MTNACVSGGPSNRSPVCLGSRYKISPGNGLESTDCTDAGLVLAGVFGQGFVYAGMSVVPLCRLGETENERKSCRTRKRPMAAALGSDASLPSSQSVRAACDEPGAHGLTNVT